MKNLKKLRQAMGFRNVESFAAELGVSRSTYQNFERGIGIPQRWRDRIIEVSESRGFGGQARAALEEGGQDELTDKIERLCRQQAELVEEIRALLQSMRQGPSGQSVTQLGR